MDSNIKIGVITCECVITKFTAYNLKCSNIEKEKYGKMSIILKYIRIRYSAFQYKEPYVLKNFSCIIKMLYTHLKNKDRFQAMTEDFS